MKHKQQLADVTNVQGGINFLERPTHRHYCETRLHRRTFANVGLYLAALNGSQVIWDAGKPEWQRKTNRPAFTELDRRSSARKRV